MSFQKLTFEEDTQSDTSENSNLQQTQEATQQQPPTQKQPQHPSQRPTIISYTPKPGSLDYKTVYEASMRELVDCQTFVEQYTRQDQLAFLEQFQYDLFYFIQQPIEVQYYVLMMTIAAQRISTQISLPYLLRDKDLLKDLIKEATYIFEDFTPDNIKDLFVQQLRWLISLIDIVRRTNPVNMLYVQQLQYDLPPTYLTRMIIRLVELVILHSSQFENLDAKLTDLKNNFDLEFKQGTAQRQALLFVVWQQNAQTIERIGKSKFVYEHPLCQFAVNETFINSILSVDERLLSVNEDYFNLVQAYFQSNGQLYMQMLSKSGCEEKADVQNSGEENVDVQNSGEQDDTIQNTSISQNTSLLNTTLNENSTLNTSLLNTSLLNTTLNENSTLNTSILNTSLNETTTQNNTTQNTSSLNNCIICYEDLPTNAFVKFDSCPHNNVCKKCFIDIIRSQQTSIFCCPTCKKEVVKIEICCQDEVMKFRV